MAEVRIEACVSFLEIWIVAELISSLLSINTVGWESEIPLSSVVQAKLVETSHHGPCLNNCDRIQAQSETAASSLRIRRLYLILTPRPRSTTSQRFRGIARQEHPLVSLHRTGIFPLS